MDETELVPCPFCRCAKPFNPQFVQDITAWGVSCPCGASVGWYASRARAAQIWNTRANGDLQQEYDKLKTLAHIRGESITLLTEQLDEARAMSRVPYREAYQRGAASRDREVDELRACIDMLSVAMCCLNLNKIDGYLFMGRSYKEIIERALSLAPAQSLQAYRNKVIERCAVELEAQYSGNIGVSVAETVRNLKSNPNGK